MGKTATQLSLPLLVAAAQVKSWSVPLVTAPLAPATVVKSTPGAEHTPDTETGAPRASAPSMRSSIMLPCRAAEDTASARERG